MDDPSSPLAQNGSLESHREGVESSVYTHTHTHTKPLTANHEHERKREERSAKEETMDTKRTNKAADKGGREAPPAEARAAENCPPPKRKQKAGRIIRLCPLK
jgi:hypothetical protein